MCNHFHYFGEVVFHTFWVRLQVTSMFGDGVKWRRVAGRKHHFIRKLMHSKIVSMGWNNRLVRLWRLWLSQPFWSIQKSPRCRDGIRAVAEPAGPPDPASHPAALLIVAFGASQDAVSLGREITLLIFAVNSYYCDMLMGYWEYWICKTVHNFRCKSIIAFQ